METDEQVLDCEAVELHGTNDEPDEAPPDGVATGGAAVVERT